MTEKQRTEKLIAEAPLIAIPIRHQVNQANYPKHIIGTFLSTKLSVFGLTPSVTKEGVEGPPKSLKGPLALCCS